MNRIIPTLFCLLVFLITACTNTPEKSSAVNNSANSGVSIPASGLYLPSLTMDMMTGLYENCNQIDYVFYELPISSSVSDAQSAQAHLRHISETPAETKTKDRCEKAIGRIFYKKDGEDLMQAEIYFAGGCAFYVFFENGKRTYSNLLTPDGVNFYNQIVESVNKAKQQIQ